MEKEMPRTDVILSSLELTALTPARSPPRLCLGGRKSYRLEVP
jgi:hypothetical protein